MTWGAMKDDVEETPGKILQKIRQNSNTTIAELATYIGVTERTIKRNIQKMQAENALRRVGSRKAGYREVLDDECKTSHK
ncbi:MAG: HTH domain-containing protein [Bacteroidales bacterium]|nr:HTH domain-containing protein [Bacteroidales bacterium]